MKIISSAHTVSLSRKLIKANYGSRVYIQALEGKGLVDYIIFTAALGSPLNLREREGTLSPLENYMHKPPQNQGFQNTTGCVSNAVPS
jgi:hypothetical protein